MHDWMNGWCMSFGFSFWLAILALIIAGVMWFFRSQSESGSGRSRGRSTGLDVLEERYARREIERDEYLQKKRDMSD
jgi:putative membrane protein